MYRTTINEILKDFKEISEIIYFLLIPLNPFNRGSA